MRGVGREEATGGNGVIKYGAAWKKAADADGVPPSVDGQFSTVDIVLNI